MAKPIRMTCESEQDRSELSKGLRNARRVEAAETVTAEGDSLQMILKALWPAALWVASQCRGAVKRSVWYTKPQALEKRQHT